MNKKEKPKKVFVKLKALGNGLGLFMTKRALSHLRVSRDSDICLTFNKNRTITISKATYSDGLIEEIIANLGNVLD